MKERFAYDTNRWKKYESYAAQRADYVVGDEAKTRLVENYNLVPEKIIVIANTEDVEYFIGLNFDVNLADKYRGQFVLTYISGFGPHQGIDVPI